MNKKIIIALLLSFVISFFIGCSRENVPFLSYQSEAFEAKATLDIGNEKYSVEIKKQKPDTYCINFLSPDTLSGVTIEKSDGQYFYSVGNLRMPIEENTNLTAKMLRLFNLSQDDMSSTDTELSNGTKVNIASFTTDYGNIKLFLSTETNLPLRFEADIDGLPLIVNFSEFKTTEKTS